MNVRQNGEPLEQVDCFVPGVESGRDVWKGSEMDVTLFNNKYVTINNIISSMYAVYAPLDIDI